jgi:hypothetical protein
MCIRSFSNSGHLCKLLSALSCSTSSIATMTVLQRPLRLQRRCPKERAKLPFKWSPPGFQTYPSVLLSWRYVTFGSPWKIMYVVYVRMSFELSKQYRYFPYNFPRELFGSFCSWPSNGTHKITPHGEILENSVNQIEFTFLFDIREWIGKNTCYQIRNVLANMWIIKQCVIES